MELNILNRSYVLMKVIDQFESLSWSDRYNEVGEFELKAVVDSTDSGLSDLLGYLVKENRCTIRESDRMMIIESISYVSDYESGDAITVSGRSLDSILDRRVVKNEITITGSLQDGILRLLNENVINPEDENRRIDGFSMKMSEDEAITSIEVNITFLGDNLLDVISSLCQTNDIGYRTLPNYENSGYIFELYKGIDRSYDQEMVAPVVFSPRYENLINSSYMDSSEQHRNVVYVDNDSLKIEVYHGLKFDYELNAGEEIAEPPKGVDRREAYLKSSVTIPQREAYGPAESEVNLEETGTWEKSINMKAYNEAVEKRRAAAERRVAEAGGEANMSWPPPGREGESYVDWYVNMITPEDFAEWHYEPGPTYAPAVLSKEEQQQQKFDNAMENPTEYARYQMRDEGLKVLQENRVVKSFDGEIVNYFQFIAGQDYFLGDIVQMVNNLFVNVKTRFTEVTFSEDASGALVIPSFLTDAEYDVKEEL